VTGMLIILTLKCEIVDFQNAVNEMYWILFFVFYL